MPNRDYKAAIEALNTLQSNFTAIKAIRDSGRALNTQSIPEMLEFARRIGYQSSDFAKFRPIHVSGTKGKGSTSAFISSILAQYRGSFDSKAPRKIGLYTSPHLCSVRERIKINNESISEKRFTKYFFEVWDRLSATGDGSKPVYFRFLTLLAFHLFMEEGVDTAVIECGIGGEYDSTNILPSCSVAAVTALGIDHVGLLGATLPEIAWHKAGIFKSGTSAFTSQQPASAMTVLTQRAESRHTRLEVVPIRADIDSGHVKLGLEGQFQKSNASLAIAVATAHMKSLGMESMSGTISESDQLPREICLGLQTVKWPGRCDRRRDVNITWCLDGAHTLESIEVAGQWFAALSTEMPKSKRILLFNQQSRDASALVKALHTRLSGAAVGQDAFNHCIFTSNITYKSGVYKPDLVSMNMDNSSVQALSVQRNLAEAWGRFDDQATTHIAGTIEEAMLTARNLAGDEEALVLVTGSLHLVGGAIELLETGGLR